MDWADEAALHCISRCTTEIGLLFSPLRTIPGPTSRVKLDSLTTSKIYSPTATNTACKLLPFMIRTRTTRTAAGRSDSALPERRELWDRARRLLRRPQIPRLTLQHLRRVRRPRRQERRLIPPLPREPRHTRLHRPGLLRIRRPILRPRHALRRVRQPRQKHPH